MCNQKLQQKGLYMELFQSGEGRKIFIVIVITVILGGIGSIVFAPSAVVIFGLGALACCIIRGLEEDRVEQVIVDLNEEHKYLIDPKKIRGWNGLQKETDRLKYIYTEDDFKEGK